MSKIEFLKELEANLRKMNDSEKNKFITYYDEIISDYIENGMTEEEAVNKIGSPAKIAVELLEDYDSVRLRLPITQNKATNMVLTIIGFPLWGSVLLSVILLILSGYIILWCAPIATGAGSVGFFIAALVGVVGAPFVMTQNISIGVMQLGAGIASIGISVLLGYITIVLSKNFVIITKKYNAKLVKLYKKKVVIQ